MSLSPLSILATAAKGGFMTSITENVIPLVGFAGLTLLMLLITVYKLYQRTSADLALVRTGWGGMKIVTDGGLLVLPVIHELLRISLKTRTLDVRREGEEALITKDPIRVDVRVHFYIRIEKEKAQIEKAGRSLGTKTLNASSIQDLVDAKLVGALRSVAATATLQELHQNREEFAKKVLEAVRDDLDHNGLTLESVSIVHLDQTDKTALNEDNVFDAQGLKLIAQQTAAAREAENERLRQAEVAIHMQNSEADQRKFELDRDVANKRELEEATKARFRLEQEEEVANREIAKNQSIDEREIARQRAVRTADIEKQQAIESRDIEKVQAIEIQDRSKEVAIAKKQQEVELEDAERLRAVAQKEEAAQAVLTVEETATAERQKQVDIIGQKAISEKQLLDRQLAADAEAYEIERQAKAEAEAAELQAQAIERLAEAKLKDAEAQALGNFKLIEAKNSTKNEIIISEAFLEAVNQLPEVVREAMKPAEKISEIKVLNVGGSGIGGGNGQHSGAGKVVSSFLEAGAAFPMFKEMLKFAGVDGDNLDLSAILRKGLQSSPEVRKFIEANVPAAVRSKLADADSGSEPSAPAADKDKDAAARKAARRKAATAKKPPSA